MNADGSQYANINAFHFGQAIGSTSHCPCEKDLIGKRLASVFGKIEAESLIRTNCLVASNKQMDVFEEQVTRQDGTQYFGLSLKFPCLNTGAQVNGIFGIALSGDKKLAQK